MTCRLPNSYYFSGFCIKWTYFSEMFYGTIDNHDTPTFVLPSDTAPLVEDDFYTGPLAQENHLQEFPTRVNPFYITGTMTSSETVYHCHKPEGHQVNHRARTQLAIVCVLCALFMVAEIAGRWRYCMPNMMVGYSKTFFTSWRKYKLVCTFLLEALI